MTLPNCIVIEVMRWSHFHNASTKIQINIFIGNDGNLTVAQRKVDRLANQMLIALIFRIDHDSNVAQQGFWAGGCDGEMT